MTNNVENWTYKNKAELEALSDDQLLNIHKELTDAIRAFRLARMPMTDEMFWQLMVVPQVISDRNLTIPQR